MVQFCTLGSYIIFINFHSVFPEAGKPNSGIKVGIENEKFISVADWLKGGVILNCFVMTVFKTHKPP